MQHVCIVYPSKYIHIQLIIHTGFCSKLTCCNWMHFSSKNIECLVEISRQNIIMEFIVLGSTDVIQRLEIGIIMLFKDEREREEN